MCKNPYDNRCDTYIPRSSLAQQFLCFGCFSLCTYFAPIQDPGVLRIDRFVIKHSLQAFNVTWLLRMHVAMLTDAGKRRSEGFTGCHALACSHASIQSLYTSMASERSGRCRLKTISSSILVRYVFIVHLGYFMSTRNPTVTK